MFKLLRGEIMKILRLPTIYILTIILCIVITFSFTLYNPEPSKCNACINQDFYDLSLTGIYNTFYATPSSQYSKNSINNLINTNGTSKNSVEDLVDYYLSVITKYNDNNEVSVMSIRDKRIEEIKNIYNKYLKLNDSIKNYLYINSEYFYPLDDNVNAIYSLLNELKSEINNKDCPKNDLNPTAAYLLTDTTYKKIIKLIEKLQKDLEQTAHVSGSTLDVTSTKDSYLLLSDKIEKDYLDENDEFTLLSLFKNNTNNLNINEKQLLNIKERYVTQANVKIQAETEILNAFKTKYIDNEEPISNEELITKKEELVNDINRIYSIAYYANLLSKCELVKILSHHYNDDDYNAFIGTSDLNKIFGIDKFNTYCFNQNFTKYSYIYDNNLVESDYGICFTTKYTSNYEIINGESAINAFDYSYYVLDIFGFVIVIFAVILASNMIAGEQKDNTMKLLAIRPYTRKQIINSKILAVLFFSLIFILLSVIISLVAGTFMYGINLNTLLITINASYCVEISPIALYCIYIITLFIKIIFYVLLAFLISTALRSYIGATVINIFFLLIATIGNNFLSQVSFWKYVPFANLDLFKYFGGGTFSNDGFSLFSNNYIIPDTNLIIGLSIALICIIVIYIVCKKIFKARDIT